MKYGDYYSFYEDDINNSIKAFLNVTDTEGLRPIYEKYRSACHEFLDCLDVIKMVPHKRVFWSKVISHYENGIIFYNPKKYNSMPKAKVLGNMVHESFHHLGYTHDYHYSKSRKWSIPYFLGYWVSYHQEQLNKKESYSLNEFINYYMVEIK